MRDILNSLFYGDIAPANKSFSENAEYNRALNELVQIENKLRETLKEEEGLLLEGLVEAGARLQSIVSRESFIDGFKKGGRIVISVFED